MYEEGQNLPAEMMPGNLKEYVTDAYQTQLRRRNTLLLMFSCISVPFTVIALTLILRAMRQLRVFILNGPGALILFVLIVCFVLSIGMTVYALAVHPKAVTQRLQRDEFTYRIGPVTNKRSVRHRRSHGHSSTSYYLSVGETECSPLHHEEFLQAELGDEFLVIFINDRPEFCLRMP